MGQTLSKNHYRLTLAYLDSSAFSPDLIRPSINLDHRPRSAFLEEAPSSLPPFDNDNDNDNDIDNDIHNDNDNDNDNDNSPPILSQLRQDSGFNDSQDNVDAEDAKDLAYIDTTYYSDLLKSINLSDDSDYYYDDEDEYDYEDQDLNQDQVELEINGEGENEGPSYRSKRHSMPLNENSRSHRHSFVLGDSSRSNRHSFVLGDSSRSNRHSMTLADGPRSQRHSMTLGDNPRSQRHSILASERRRSHRSSMPVTSSRPRSQRNSILLNEHPSSQRHSTLLNEHPSSQRHSMLVSEHARSRRQSRHLSMLQDVDHIVDIADGADLDPSWVRMRLGDIVDARQIDLSSRLVRQISGNIGFITPLTNLVLSDNLITNLPPTIGALVNLSSLNLSSNSIAFLPLELFSLPKLTELNLSHNRISSLPPAIGALTKLTSLILDHNIITELPQEIGRLKSLTTLDVSHNPLPDFPAELSRLPLLRRLRTESCPMALDFHHNLAHNPPSLLETCARFIVRHNLPLPSDIREDTLAYLRSAKTCSFCGGPFFRSFVRRGRLVQRAEDVYLPFVYMLCSQHWNDESERIRVMFTGPAATTPTPQRSISTSASASSSSPSQPSPLAQNDAAAVPQTPLPDRRHSSFAPSRSMSKSVNRLSSIFFPSRFSEGPADEAFSPGSTHSPAILSTNTEGRTTSKFLEAEKMRIARWGCFEAGPIEI